MARLLGFISNRSDLGPRVLGAQAPHLKARRSNGSALGWGVGFTQFGEVLLRRRPLDERPEIDLSEATSGLKTELLTGHVRQPTVGNLRTENTHPFRYRQWLFAQTGTIEGFAQLRERLLDVQPAFLRPNVRGDTDSELFFYLFLSYLHDEGHLSGHHTPLSATQNALRSALRLVDGMCDEAGLPKPRGDILVTNGEYLLGVHRSGQMGVYFVNDEQELDALLNPDPNQSNRVRNLEQIRCTLLASELPELPQGWTRAAVDHFVVATRMEAPASTAIATDPSN